MPCVTTPAPTKTPKPVTSTGSTTNTGADMIRIDAIPNVRGSQTLQGNTNSSYTISVQSVWIYVIFFAFVGASFRTVLCMINC